MSPTSTHGNLNQINPESIHNINPFHGGAGANPSLQLQLVELTHRDKFILYGETRSITVKQRSKNGQLWSNKVKNGQLHGQIGRIRLSTVE